MVSKHKQQNGGNEEKFCSKFHSFEKYKLFKIQNIFPRLFNIDHWSILQRWVLWYLLAVSYDVMMERGSKMIM